MIDLRFADLPSRLECDGFFYEVDTDFRTWIEFERVLRNQGAAWSGIFMDEIPDSPNWVEGAIEFLQSKNATPRSRTIGNTERAFDYILDGDYIVAAFQQAYGIDLTSIDHMHWHRFTALMNGLPKETKMAEIMGYRCWKPSKKKHDDEMRELKAAWRLPEGESAEVDDEVLKYADDFFG